MKSKIITLAVSAMLFLVSFPVQAQQPTKVPRLGYLSGNDPATDSIRSEPLRAALRELGYIEGQNIVIEYRYAEGKADRANELAAELVRLKVDILMVAGGDRWIRTAMNATKTIPIVLMGQGRDPVEAGYVESLARPGGNVTGFTFLTEQLGSKRLELLKEAVPKLARVAVLYDPATGIAREVKEDLPVAARALGLTVQPREIRDADGFERVLAALSKERPDGLYAPSAGPVMQANQKRIADFSLRSRLPSVYANKAAVEAGGLMFYGADLEESYRRIAYYVDRVLKGTKPANLPVERPKTFEFVINQKTAKEIGLTVSPDLLARATRIIR